VTGDHGDDNHENQIMAMPGLYDVWKRPYSEPLLAYTITTWASPRISAYRVGRGVLSSVSLNSGPGNDRVELIRAA
jgi:hypothetical protein